jgi:energy-coupling factor transporter ATP-binding protein EcfA2
MQTLLEIHDLTVRYHPASRPVIESCTLGIGEGERVALFGLNGSGKTSLLFAVAGILPHEGAIVVDGIRLSTGTIAQVRSRLGVLFANPDDQLLFPRVRDDVAFGLARKGLDAVVANTKATTMMEAMGIAAFGEHAPYTLSHGQKVRVALAGALVHDPPVLLLDEPSAALDPPGRRALAELLRKQRGAMLIATHDVEFTRWCCTRFLLLEGGRIVKDTADPEEIRL